jgi:hypothetical protein
MKFKPGNATDTKLCIALKHEFLRCDDAFKDFVSFANTMIGQGESPRISYKAYNAYAIFVHHLYEFMMGAIARERQDTGPLKSGVADRYIAVHAQRILTNRRMAILNGTAPPWENDISYYPERIPETFASNFRRVRNVATAHVSAERSDLSLTSFYDQSHKYLYMLYYEVKSWWGRQGNEFPDLKEITAFSVFVREDPPSQP